MDTDDAARWIGRTRRELGLTQAALSAESGVSLATVQNIEAGTANPSLATLRKLFGALGLRLRVGPDAADWDLLARFGLPLTTTESRPPRAGIEDLPEQVRQAALELSRGEQGEARQRKLESLQALLFALSQHFPSVYRRWFGRVPIVRSLIPPEPSGRIIKLARVARSRLGEAL
jgi:transcriptional regulator with XRE-family HTH domain